MGTDTKPFYPASRKSFRPATGADYGHFEQVDWFKAPAEFPACAVPGG
jgi:hypothetical protein